MENIEIKKPTIQERIQKRVHEILEPIEIWLDRYVTSPEKFNPDKFKLVDVFKKQQVGGVHARKIMEMYEPQYKEYKDLLILRSKNLKFKEITDEEDNDSEERQLLESYEDVDNETIQKGIKAFDNIFEACDRMIAIANANRKPRKKKEKSPEQLVAKMQFKKNDEKANLESIDPAEIIYAEQVWVYNTKTRKLGHYIAKVLDPRGMNRPGTGLMVKGTSIKGFDEENSIQKTLRKPEEQLKEFANSGPKKVIEVFDAIKTMGIKLNGRVNSEVILLRAVR
jgi:hypothetical protein|tara:strand:- start:437 stop:1279 length:843 start_codon:yes stop_codon:yes gene_type:complete